MRCAQSAQSPRHLPSTCELPCSLLHHHGEKCGRWVLSDVVVGAVALGVLGVLGVVLGGVHAGVIVGGRFGCGVGEVLGGLCEVGVGGHGVCGFCVGGVMVGCVSV